MTAEKDGLAKPESEVPRYAWYEAFWRSWGSDAFLTDAALRWPGIASKLFLTLVFVEALSLSLGLLILLQTMTAKYLPILRSDLPPAEIKDGKLITEEAKRYTLSDESGKIFLIIDTTAVAVPENLEVGQMFLGRRGYVVNRPYYGYQSTSYANLGQNIVLNDAYLDKLEAWAWQVPFLLFLPASVGIFCYRILVVVVLSMIILHVIGSRKLSLGFDEGARAAVVAMTPPVLVGAVLNLCWIDIPYSWTALTFFLILWGWTAARMLARGLRRADGGMGL